MQKKKGGGEPTTTLTHNIKSDTPNDQLFSHLLLDFPIGRFLWSPTQAHFLSPHIPSTVPQSKSQ